MAVLTGKTAFDNFFGKGAKEKRKKRRANRDKKRELRLRKKQAKVERLEVKKDSDILDNQAKQVQIQTTNEIANQEIMQPQPQQMPQQPNRNRNMWIVGGVVGVILIGLLIFFMTKD